MLVGQREDVVGEREEEKKGESKRYVTNITGSINNSNIGSLSEGRIFIYQQGVKCYGLTHERMLETVNWNFISVPTLYILQVGTFLRLVNQKLVRRQSDYGRSGDLLPGNEFYQ